MEDREVLGELEDLMPVASVQLEHEDGVST